MAFLDSQGGGAWPILVGGVICLVNFGNERDPYEIVARGGRTVLVFLSRPSAQAEGSWGLNQVCDALRYSGRHARYNEPFSMSQF